MSSDCIRRRAILLGLFALTGCGFAPVYGNGGGMHEKVSFLTDPSIAGYRLRERLEQRLGIAKAPLYQLAVTITDSRQTSAIAADGDTTRFNVIGTARWTLRGLSDDLEVATGKVEAFTSYSTTGSTTATQAAETDAEARLSVALADMIVSRLLIATAELPR